MNIHNRKSIRLKNYDYSKNGMYFITICTQNRENLFGEITLDEDLVPRMILNNMGEMINKVYLEIINRFPNTYSINHVVMPNHFHCIICIDNISLRKTFMYKVVQAFKSKTTIDCIRGVKEGLYASFNKRLWQRNYYEHIIRNEKEFEIIWKYIIENPLRWNNDCYNN